MQSFKINSPSEVFLRRRYTEWRVAITTKHLFWICRSFIFLPWLKYEAQDTTAEIRIIVQSDYKQIVACPHQLWGNSMCKISPKNKSSSWFPRVIPNLFVSSVEWRRVDLLFWCWFDTYKKSILLLTLFWMSVAAFFQHSSECHVLIKGAVCQFLTPLEHKTP